MVWAYITASDTHIDLFDPYEPHQSGEDEAQQIESAALGRVRRMLQASREDGAEEVEILSQRALLHSLPVGPIRKFGETTWLSIALWSDPLPGEMHVPTVSVQDLAVEGIRIVDSFISLNMACAIIDSAGSQMPGEELVHFALVAQGQRDSGRMDF